MLQGEDSCPQGTEPVFEVTSFFEVIRGIQLVGDYIEFLEVSGPLGRARPQPGHQPSALLLVILSVLFHDSSENVLVLDVTHPRAEEVTEEGSLRV